MAISRRSSSEAVARGDAPSNPLLREEKNIGNQAFRRVIDRALKTQETLTAWPGTRKALSLIAEQIRKNQSSVDQARVDTKHVLNPKLVASYPGGLFHYVFNPVADQLIVWKSASMPISRGSAYFVHDLKTRKRTMGRLGKFAEIFVRKNGEVWSAAVNRENQIVVLRWPSKTPHMTLPFKGDQNDLDLFETPDGRMILVNSTTMKGVYAYDISAAAPKSSS